MKKKCLCICLNLYEEAVLCTSNQNNVLTSGLVTGRVGLARFATIGAELAKDGACLYLPFPFVVCAHFTSENVLTSVAGWQVFERLFVVER